MESRFWDTVAVAVNSSGGACEFQRLFSSGRFSSTLSHPNAAMHEALVILQDQL